MNARTHTSIHNAALRLLSVEMLAEMVEEKEHAVAALRAQVATLERELNITKAMADVQTAKLEHVATQARRILVA